MGKYNLWCYAKCCRKQQLFGARQIYQVFQVNIVSSKHFCGVIGTVGGLDIVGFVHHLEQVFFAQVWVLR